MEALKVRNRTKDAKQMDIYKIQVLARDIRVIIEPSPDRRGFFVSAQQYLPDCSYPWEVRPDGWRCTASQWCATFEAAKRVFDATVRNESRYVESRRR